MGLKQFTFATVCGVFLLWGDHGMAQEWEMDQSMVSPSIAPQQVPASCDDLPAGSDEEQQAREVCILHAQVQKALEQQQWLEVELLLERVLMYQPNDAEAMLQLAMVLAVRDRTASAKALVETLRDDERTSEGHRLRLQAMLDNEDLRASAQAVNAAVHGSQAVTQLIWSVGRSSNPMARSSADSITLTLPDGDMALALSEKPRSATTFNTLLYQRWANGLEMLLGTQSANLSGTHTGARIALAGPLGLSEPLFWNLSSQQSLDGARRDVASVLWSPSRRAAATSQALYSLGVFSENQSQRHGLLLRVQAGLGQWQQGQVSLQLDGWAEYEYSLNATPSAVRTGIQGNWGVGQGWQVQSYLYAQQDLKGYSPLLRHNQARQLLTGYLAFEKQWPEVWLGGRLSSSLYLSRRWSNLALYQWQDRGISLSWKRSW